jgi:hypothetical protein
MAELAHGGSGQARARATAKRSPPGSDSGWRDEGAPVRLKIHPISDTTPPLAPLTGMLVIRNGASTGGFCGRRRTLQSYATDDRGGSP